MTRLPITAVALLLATCQPSDEYVNASASPENPAIRALLAFDFDDALGPQSSAAPGITTSPTGAELHIDGRPVAFVAFNRDEVLQGRAAWSIAAGTMVKVEIELVGTREHVRSAPLDVTADADAVVRLKVRRSEDGRVTVQRETDSAVYDDTGATVDYRKADAPQAWLARLGSTPAAALAAMLRDPQVAADSIGPLVAFAALNDGSSTVTSTSGSRVATANIGADDGTSTPPVTDEPRTATGGGLAKPALASADVASAKVVPAFVRYYSYCSCGKPVVDRAFDVRATDAAGKPIAITGHTDWFGMLLARNTTDAKVSFGAGQRERKRSYAFVGGTEQTRHDVLAALSHPDPNETLTALLDLRSEPLPSAKDKLIELLAKDNEVVWRNAAVTLSYYADIEAVVDRHIAEFAARGHDTERVAFILGALRHPRALPTLADGLLSKNAALRRVCAWSIGFVAHPAGRALLLEHADDMNPEVREQVALGLGRIGGDESLETLEQLQGDADPKVAMRAKDAIGRL